MSFPNYSEEPAKKPLCGYCYKEDEIQNLKYCANCEEVRYCSRACQIAHWKGGHRFQCRTKVSQTSERVVSYQRPEVDLAAQQQQQQQQQYHHHHHDESCPICMETLSACSTSRVILPCQHAFHRSCVEGLRAHGVAQVCPICRARLPPSAEKLREDATMRYFNLERKVHRGEVAWESLSPDGVRELTQVAIQWQAAADDGDVLAQLCIGNKYMEGMGIALTPDINKAEYYLSRASEQGNPQAQYNLGTIFFQKAQKEYAKDNGTLGHDISGGVATQQYHGHGQIFSVAFNVYKDKAYQLWSMAAEQNDPNALYNLALMYRKGCLNNGEPDINKALYLLGRAADLGYERANECINFIRREDLKLT